MVHGCWLERFSLFSQIALENETVAEQKFSLALSSVVNPIALILPQCYSLASRAAGEGTRGNLENILNIVRFNNSRTCTSDPEIAIIHSLKSTAQALLSCCALFGCTLLLLCVLQHPSTDTCCTAPFVMFTVTFTDSKELHQNPMIEPIGTIPEIPSLTRGFLDDIVDIVDDVADAADEIDDSIDEIEDDIESIGDRFDDDDDDDDNDDDDNGGGDRNRLKGTRGDDQIEGNNKNNNLKGLQGDDEIDGRNGNDALFGGSGNDALVGNNGNDRLVGEAGEDTLSGGDGRDQLLGGGAKDVLFGGKGDDVLDGQDGDDIVFGGRTGRDTLTGGTGRDIFGTKRKSGLDVVTDYVDGVDRIGLAKGLDFRKLTFTQQAGGTLITAGSDQLLFVNNATATSFTKRDTISET